MSCASLAVNTFTTAPRPGSRLDQALDASTFSASRSGVRDTPSWRARSSSAIADPAASVPSTIMSRTRTVTSSCSDPRGMGSTVAGGRRGGVGREWVQVRDFRRMAGRQVMRNDIIMHNYKL